MDRSNSFRIAAILIGLIIIGVYSIYTYNKLAMAAEDIDAKRNQIYSHLQRKLNLIPSLLETGQAYAEQEKEIFASIDESRTKLAKAETIGEKAQADADLSRALSNLGKAVEEHPEIKSDAASQQLYGEFVKTEELLTTARRDYNQAVRAYNTHIKRFPANVVAILGGFERQPYFEAAETTPVSDE